nr:MAG TPA: hypothetical protein [Caudoviricetes sp.]
MRLGRNIDCMSISIQYVKFLTRHPEDVKNHTDEAGRNTLCVH